MQENNKSKYKNLPNGATVENGVITPPIESYQDITKEDMATPENAEDLKREFLDKPKQGIDLIAKYLISKYHFKTIAGKNDELYIYDAGFYTQDRGTKIIKAEVEKTLEELATVHYITEIIEKIKRLSYVEETKEQFGNNDINLICVENGILNIQTSELKIHTPEIVFLNKLPIVYDPQARCPAIKQFFADTLYQEDIGTMQELFGYCLLRNYFIKKAVIIVGETNGGKTQMAELMKRFIGKDNISGENLQNLTSNRFAVISLYNKHANIYDDLDFDDIGNSGVFKMATGSSTLTGEYKFGDRFQFNSYAKLIFTANKIPQVKNKDLDDDAYYSRWIVLRFDNTFDENNPKKDPYILQKITTDTEISGLLNYAIEGLKRLRIANKFSYDKNPEEVRLIMQRSGSSLASFAQDELMLDESSSITKDGLYQRYSEYTAKKGLSRQDINKVGRNLPKFAPYIEDKRSGKIRSWGNVAFKEPIKESESEQEEILKGI